MCACTHTVVASSYDSVRAVDFSTGRIEIYFCFDVVYFLNTSNNRDGQCFPTGFPVALCVIRKTQYYCCGRRNYSAESSSPPPPPPVCPPVVREDANAWPVSKSLRVPPPHHTVSTPFSEGILSLVGHASDDFFEWFALLSYTSSQPSVFKTFCDLSTVFHSVIKKHCSVMYRQICPILHRPSTPTLNI